ncbi:DUF4400 domain-containing protein [Azomonas macrocytogenes]|uniref:DUF4400 domain-containing protein n=1 Tax=Azomonas macrocytogenes TaxID=69962 RepID=A0A839T6Y5_AZOMA|nr:DUF4400 domain-containing protein [Azomonas macrocytogenes]MBB3105241.1 hypothetical protein [Azomonas macrocytogenes]
MNKPFWLVAFLLCLEIVLIMVLLPGDVVQQAIHKEAGYVEHTLGAEAQGMLMEKANQWHQSLLFDSGVYDSLYYTLIPTEKQREASGSIKTMGSGWFRVVENRLEALSLVVYQLLARFALVLTWAPYMLLLLIPALYDGYMTWQIKRTNFAYVSPVIHRYSVRGALILVGVMAIGFFLPVAIDPTIIPLVLMVVCILMGLATGNMQKRI